jgi:hypothetical protein
MTPAEIVASLDAALAEDGEDIILRRTVSGVNTDVTCRAFVRAVSAEQLMAGVSQDNSNVIISPTEIINNGWPGTSTLPDSQDARVPVTTDKLVIAGKSRAIKTAQPIYVAGELVRINIMVLG